MDQNQTQTWYVSWYVKAIYIPNMKWIYESTNEKVRKTENSWYFSKSKGHNFLKNQWRMILELDLYLDMSKQYTKYQMNIYESMNKKVRKTKNSYFSSPRAITSWETNGSKPNSSLICILVWQSKKYQMNIWKHEQKECGKLRIYDIL
jgi:hypothetical protein